MLIFDTIIKLTYKITKKSIYLPAFLSIAVQTHDPTSSFQVVKEDQTFQN